MMMIPLKAKSIKFEIDDQSYTYVLDSKTKKAQIKRVVKSDDEKLLVPAFLKFSDEYYKIVGFMPYALQLSCLSGSKLKELNIPHTFEKNQNNINELVSIFDDLSDETKKTIDDYFGEPKSEVKVKEEEEEVKDCFNHI